MAKRLEGMRTECRRLRVEERKSYDEICALTGVSKGSLHYWLKDLPLNEDEKRARRACAGSKSRKIVGENRRYKPGEPSKFKLMVTGGEMTNNRLMKISESAVTLRLLLAGLNIFNSPFDNEIIDVMVQNPVSGRIMKIQVKTANQVTRGSPTICLVHKCGYNRTRYKEGEFDFIVGYNLHRDTAYVLSWEECAGNSTAISVRDDMAERWDKLV